MAKGGWVAVDKETGAPVGEFFNHDLKARLNTQKYRAVDILEYLQQLNKRIKAQQQPP